MVRTTFTVALVLNTVAFFIENLRLQKATAPKHPRATVKVAPTVGLKLITRKNLNLTNQRFK
jgi:hypothetical protein